MAYLSVTTTTQYKKQHFLTFTVMTKEAFVTHAFEIIHSMTVMCEVTFTMVHARIVMAGVHRMPVEMAQRKIIERGPLCIRVS